MHLDLEEEELRCGLDGTWRCLTFSEKGRGAQGQYSSCSAPQLVVVEADHNICFLGQSWEM